MKIHSNHSQLSVSLLITENSRTWHCLLGRDEGLGGRSGPNPNHINWRSFRYPQQPSLPARHRRHGDSDFLQHQLRYSQVSLRATLHDDHHRCRVHQRPWHQLPICHGPSLVLRRDILQRRLSYIFTMRNRLAKRLLCHTRNRFDWNFRPGLNYE